MKEPTVGAEFIWLIGKPGMWEEMRETIRGITRQKLGGVFSVTYGADNETKLECQIIWDPKLKAWVRYG